MDRGVVNADAGEGHVTFRQILTTLRPFYWRVTGLNALVAVGALVFLVTFLLWTALIEVPFALMVLLLLCVLFPMALLLRLWLLQCVNASLVEDLRVREALERG